MAPTPMIPNVPSSIYAPAKNADARTFLLRSFSLEANKVDQCFSSIHFYLPFVFFPKC